MGDGIVAAAAVPGTDVRLDSNNVNISVHVVKMKLFRRGCVDNTILSPNFPLDPNDEFHELNHDARRVICYLSLDVTDYKLLEHK